jgi:hypothetical protein
MIGNRINRIIGFLFIIIAFSISSVFSADKATFTLIPISADSPPAIDGILDDPVWSSEPQVSSVFISYYPADGTRLPQLTKVWVAYDTENLYFAFNCLDSDSQLIKTSVTRRDEIGGDDWVGVGLDSIGNKQNLYEFIVNPNGIQYDGLVFPNGAEDKAADWVWHSGAKMNSDGYSVEIQIPLKNIRYSSGENVEMGVAFFRQISRIGVCAAWPELPPGRSMADSAQRIVFDKIDNQSKIEILPSVTSSSLWSRLSPPDWSSADTVNEIGTSVKYGISSSLILEGTLNPDFSQVESDTFQVLVNQRYPVFYSEKRPFFMEASSFFELAGGGETNNVYTFINTRQIVNPEWGLKLSGEMKGLSFAFLGAGDESAGIDSRDGTNPYFGKNADFMIGRAKYSLGGDNYIGAIYSGRELGDSYNRIIGSDFRAAFNENHTIKGNLMYSLSDEPNGIGETDGWAGFLQYYYYSKPLGMSMQVEHYGQDFRMDSAFIKRTGMSSLSLWFCPQIYPDKEQYPWIEKIRIPVNAYYIHDKTTGLDDYMLMAALAMFTTKQGWFRIDYALEREIWAGESFDKGILHLYAQMQIANWLWLSGQGIVGDGIFYDASEPFMGESLYFYLTATIQPSDNLKQVFTFTHENLEKPETGDSAYEVNILLSKTTYQFDEHLLARAIIQWDSYREVVLTDLLLSYTLVPGTVLHLGYGSLYDNREWNGESWVSNTLMSKYYQTTQSLFFKISYLFQI